MWRSPSSRSSLAVVRPKRPITLPIPRHSAPPWRAIVRRRCFHILPHTSDFTRTGPRRLTHGARAAPSVVGIGPWLCSLSPFGVRAEHTWVGRKPLGTALRGCRQTPRNISPAAAASQCVGLRKCGPRERAQLAAVGAQLEIALGTPERNFLTGRQVQRKAASRRGRSVPPRNGEPPAAVRPLPTPPSRVGSPPVLPPATRKRRAGRGGRPSPRRACCAR
jgi:hypothetical protein